ncbi:hypothetical protein B0H13DRAFT_2329928 [Mycena leptocephala]|nr:hypothetical protein B0H13DRAFT_2329928 [Mycena leptocephala]
MDVTAHIGGAPPMPIVRATAASHKGTPSSTLRLPRGMFFATVKKGARISMELPPGLWSLSPASRRHPLSSDDQPPLKSVSPFVVQPPLRPGRKISDRMAALIQPHNTTKPPGSRYIQTGGVWDMPGNNNISFPVYLPKLTVRRVVAADDQDAGDGTSSDCLARIYILPNLGSPLPPASKPLLPSPRPAALTLRCVVLAWIQCSPSQAKVTGATLLISHHAEVGGTTTKAGAGGNPGSKRRASADAPGGGKSAKYQRLDI